MASAGSVGLSSAMTSTPLRARLRIAGTIALESLAVMRMIFAPAAIMFSIAVTWPALSPSFLPAAVSSCAPFGCAAACAPSFIFTKKGLVSVLVIRPITGCCASRRRRQAPAHASTAITLGVRRPRLVARLVRHARIVFPRRLGVALRLRAPDLRREVAEQGELLHHAEIVRSASRR